MNPKVSDFGLSRIMENEKSYQRTQNAIGPVVLSYLNIVLNNTALDVT